MKLLAICGSPRKGNTYSSLNSIKDSFPDIDYELLMLKDMDFEMCRGCYVCVMKGEDRCPIKDERDIIFDKIAEADGIIFASPVYSHMISAIMKNLIDRMGFYAHRPKFFDKYAMSLVTCSGYGGQYAIEYLEKMLSVFGFNLSSSLELQKRPGKMSEKNKLENQMKLEKAITALITRIEKGGKDKPTIDLMVPFNIFKYVSQTDEKVMSADYEYYKDKNDYYYDVDIPFYKKMIANRVVKQIINSFD